MRYALISICLRNAHYEICVRHCYEFIQYAQQHQQVMQTPEFDQVIIWLVESFIKLRSCQSIIGLHEWLSKTLKQQQKSSFDWILNAAAKEAQGRLELASLEYKKQVIANSNPVDSGSSSLLFLRYQNEKLFNSYFQLHDWKGYLEWYDEFKLLAKNDEFIGSSSSSIDVNFIKCLNSFELLNDNELTRVHLKECTHFKSLDELNASFSSRYNTDEIERATYKEIYKNIMNKR